MLLKIKEQKQNQQNNDLFTWEQEEINSYS